MYSGCGLKRGTNKEKEGVAGAELYLVYLGQHIDQTDVMGVRLAVFECLVTRTHEQVANATQVTLALYHEFRA